MAHCWETAKSSSVSLAVISVTSFSRQHSPHCQSNRLTSTPPLTTLVRATTVELASFNVYSFSYTKNEVKSTRMLKKIQEKC